MYHACRQAHPCMQVAPGPPGTSMHPTLEGVHPPGSAGQGAAGAADSGGGGAARKRGGVARAAETAPAPAAAAGPSQHGHVKLLSWQEGSGWRVELVLEALKVGGL